MSASLDKSLDEIIASKPSVKKSFKGKKLGTKNAKVGKAPHKARPGVKKAATVSAKSPAAAARVIDASTASKAVVYGLPKDIKQDAIKDFFQSQVGSVHTVALSYNEKGQSKGIATIIFKNAAAAQKAVAKYNGAPIDGGKNNLKIELILDPTKKPLTTRIQANAIPKAERTLNIKANRLAKAGPSKTGPAKAAAKKGKPKAKKPVKKTKKTLEELDQEMTDYFEKKE